MPQRIASIGVCLILGLTIDAPAQESRTPAQQSIDWAQKAVDVNPGDPLGHSDLALALARRARETGDASYYDRAEKALQRALDMNPSALDAQKARIWILNGRHQFQAAREAARALSQRVPDDISIYGLLADANIGLGNYEDAEDSVQWMLNLRPKNPSGQIRTAELRALFGDIDGSLAMYGTALTSTAPAEVEDRASILSEMGHLLLSTGSDVKAEAVLQQALALFPHYHFALQYLGELRVSQQRYNDAVVVLKDLYSAVPTADNLYRLADALALSKDPTARERFAQFERLALAEMPSADNANRALVTWYLDYAHNAPQALRVAEHEFAVRQDVYTLDAYARALAANGQLMKAQEHVDRALATGIQDSTILYHASVIASRRGDRDRAVRYLNQSLELNPHSRVAAASRALLSELTGKPASKPASH